MCLQRHFPLCTITLAETTPITADISATRRIFNAARIFGLRLFDRLVLGGSEHNWKFRNKSFDYAFLQKYDFSIF